MNLRVRSIIFLTAFASLLSSCGEDQIQYRYVYLPAEGSTPEESAPTSPASGDPTGPWLDLSFNSGGIYAFVDSNLETGGSASSVIKQGDGYIIAGHIKQAGSTVAAVWRLNSDGSLDKSFGNTQGFHALSGTGSMARSVELQSDGKIIIGGYIDNSGVPEASVWRLSPTGSTDLSFGGGDGEFTSTDLDQILGLEILSNGILVVGTKLTSGGIIKINADGSNIDSTFGTNGVVFDNAFYATMSSAKVLSDGKILVAGESGTNSRRNVTVWKFHANGTFDSDFGTNGKFLNASNGDSGKQIEVLGDGKILVAGVAHILNRGSHAAVWRLTSTGQRDASFAEAGEFVYSRFENTTSEAFALISFSTGEIVLAGFLENSMAAWKLNSTGTLVTPFGGPDGIYTYDYGAGRGLGIVLEAEEQKAIIVGDVNDGNAQRAGIWRLNL